MISGIILAGGKGTRINSKKINKVVIPFDGKPMIVYGVELFKEICNSIILVVGAYAQSVKDIFKKEKLIYVHQRKRLGTGHAAKVGLTGLKKNSPSLVLIGYGDHLMFYKKKTIKQLINLHKNQKAVVSLISAIYKNPDELAWGRIIRDKKGNVLDIVEQKDATPEQRKIKELNAGFYCFDYKFVKNNIGKIKKSPVSGEYYLTDIVKIAAGKNKKVAALKVPFSEVGIGVNRIEELQESQKLFKKR